MEIFLCSARASRMKLLCIVQHRQSHLILEVEPDNNSLHLIVEKLEFFWVLIIVAL